MPTAFEVVIEGVSQLAKNLNICKATYHSYQKG